MLYYSNMLVFGNTNKGFRLNKLTDKRDEDGMPVHRTDYINWTKKGIRFRPHRYTSKAIFVPFADGWTYPRKMGYDFGYRPNLQCAQDYIDEVVPYLEHAWPIVADWYENTM